MTRWFCLPRTASGLLAGVVLLCSLLQTGCQTSPPPQKDAQSGVFRMNLGAEPPTLDPVEADDSVSITVISNLMRGLVAYGPHQQIEPACAQSWQVLDGGKTYRFTLNPKAQWSDGKPVTASDFVTGFHRVLDPKNGSPYAFLLFDLKGAKAYYEGTLKDPTQIGIYARDPRHLEIRLIRPVAYFLNVLAFTIALPQRGDLLATVGAQRLWSDPKVAVSNGPYRLDEWVHENRLVLSPNPSFYGGAPRNAGVLMLMIPDPNTSLMMYEGGELDFVETASSLPVKEVRCLKGRPDYHHMTLHGISYLGFNTQKPPFNDVRVRRAFIQALDRSWVPQIFQSGEQPLTGWITPGMVGYDPNAGLALNIKKAQATLVQAGYAHGQTLPPIELWFANTSPENRQIAEIAQYQWRKNLGVSVALKNSDWKTYLKQLDTDPPQIYRLQWYVDYPDPDSFMSMFLAQSGNNHTRWKNAQYDAWVTQAAGTLDRQKRAQLYQKAQKMLLQDEAVIMPLYAIPKSYLLKPKVHGFGLDALNVVNLSQIQVDP